jgi:hypothetical protein
MNVIKILKNGITIKTIPYTVVTLQRCFNQAHSIAGGLWNGVDEFKVVIEGEE